MELVNNDKVNIALKCYQLIINYSPVVSHTNKQACTIYAKGNIAASQHYWREEDSTCLNTILEKLGPSVLLPNAESIQSTSQGQLPLSTKLSYNENTATRLLQLKKALLISIGQ